jgi:hypothetical protein
MHRHKPVERQRFLAGTGFWITATEEKEAAAPPTSRIITAVQAL